MKYERIPGFFDYPEVYDYIFEQLSNGDTFVEVGSWEGRSAAYMAEKLQSAGKQVLFDCVDIWKRFPSGFEHPNITAAGGTIVDVFVNNLRYCNLLQCVNVIQASTFKAVKMYDDNSLQAVFIDNDHTYKHVKKELELWFPKIKVGGVLVGHDYNLPEDNFGVRRAVTEFISENTPAYGDFFTTGSCYAFQKLEM